MAFPEIQARGSQPQNSRQLAHWDRTGDRYFSITLQDPTPDNVKQAADMCNDCPLRRIMVDSEGLVGLSVLAVCRPFYEELPNGFLSMPNGSSENTEAREQVAAASLCGLHPDDLYSYMLEDRFTLPSLLRLIVEALYDAK